MGISIPFIIYIDPVVVDEDLKARNNLLPQVRQPVYLTKKIMGDKSPKSNQKKSTQKQVKATTVDQKKKQAVAAKAAPAKKK